MLRYLFLSLLFFGCLSSEMERDSPESFENVHFSFEGLQKIYLDTAKEGITIGINYHDRKLSERDSIKFGWAELDRDFNWLNDIERLELVHVSDTHSARYVRFAADSLPCTYIYEIVAVYMSPPDNRDSLEWKLDTVVKDYLRFNIYDDPIIYSQKVDSFGLDPVVFISEDGVMF
jgi:hypothetical protein